MFRKQSGVTLIEVLVTLLITTVGLLGLAALQLGALKATSDSAQRSQAVWLMQDLIERMRANPRGLTAEYLSAADCSSYPDQMCASYKITTGGPVEASDCTAAQMATFDRWETQCQYSVDSAINHTSRDSIASGGENILTLTDVNADGEVSLTASWVLRGKTADGVSTIGDAFKQDVQR